MSPGVPHRGVRGRFAEPVLAVRREQIFITTFAPVYGPDHSRHQYDAGGKRSAWVLFQPEFSFARRNIACGHEATNVG